MGHRVNPNSFRLNVNRSWVFQWSSYHNENYKYILLNDFFVSKIIKTLFLNMYDSIYLYNSNTIEGKTKRRKLKYNFLFYHFNVLRYCNKTTKIIINYKYRYVNKKISRIKNYLRIRKEEDNNKSFVKKKFVLRKIKPYYKLKKKNNSCFILKKELYFPNLNFIVLEKLKNEEFIGKKIIRKEKKKDEQFTKLKKLLYEVKRIVKIINYRYKSYSRFINKLEKSINNKFKSHLLKKIVEGEEEIKPFKLIYPQQYIDYDGIKYFDEDKNYFRNLVEQNPIIINKEKDILEKKLKKNLEKYINKLNKDHKKGRLKKKKKLKVNEKKLIARFNALIGFLLRIDEKLKLEVKSEKRIKILNNSLDKLFSFFLIEDNKKKEKIIKDFDKIDRLFELHTCLFFHMFKYLCKSKKKKFTLRKKEKLINILKNLYNYLKVYRKKKELKNKKSFYLKKYLNIDLINFLRKKEKERDQSDEEILKLSADLKKKKYFDYGLNFKDKLKEKILIFFFKLRILFLFLLRYQIFLSLKEKISKKVLIKLLKSKWSKINYMYKIYSLNFNYFLHIIKYVFFVVKFNQRFKYQDSYFFFYNVSIFSKILKNFNNNKFFLYFFNSTFDNIMCKNRNYVMFEKKNIKKLESRVNLKKKNLKKKKKKVKIIENLLMKINNYRYNFLLLNKLSFLKFFYINDIKNYSNNFNLFFFFSLNHNLYKYFENFFFLNLLINFYRYNSVKSYLKFNKKFIFSKNLNFLNLNLLIKSKKERNFLLNKPKNLSKTLMEYDNYIFYINEKRKKKKIKIKKNRYYSFFLNFNKNYTNIIKYENKFLRLKKKKKLRFNYIFFDPSYYQSKKRKIDFLKKRQKNIKYNIYKNLFMFNTLNAHFITYFIKFKCNFLSDVIGALAPSIRFLREKQIVYKGFKILLKGRFSRKLRKRILIFNVGKVPSNTISFPIQYDENFFMSRYGKTGIKVWFLNLRNFKKLYIKKILLNIIMNNKIKKLNE